MGKALVNKEKKPTKITKNNLWEFFVILSLIAIFVSALIFAFNG